MAEIGKLNTLRVVKEVEFGMYLDGGEHGEILIPKRYVPEACKPDDNIEVFIYLDSEDRIIATTEKPYAKVGEFALLKVVSVNNMGAFLDWGLPKDLLVPFREQKVKMSEGKMYLVFIYLDQESQRIVASARLDKFVDNLPAEYQPEEEVELLICETTELGYKSIINNTHWGMLYKNEVFQPLVQGQRIKGYINRIREDEKIDLMLNKPGYEKINSLSEKILELLKQQGGFIEVSDKSPAEKIYELFGLSKKNYKKAVGKLFKSRQIILEKEGIRLNI
ncbi:MAG: GntR family transcriptional regulator [Bacteroidales bacterium]|nr:GntR family transcriptional regulator [Bacteroidales bacterium]